MNNMMRADKLAYAVHARLSGTASKNITSFLGTTSAHAMVLRLLPNHINNDILLFM